MMLYTDTYNSPLGEIILACDDEGLTGLWFSGQKYFPDRIFETHIVFEHEHILCAKRWLDIYFSGKNPDFTPPLHIEATLFRSLVTAEMLKIPYGETVTYGELSKRLGKEKMSAQAVGGAVGHNRVLIIVPCHRVVGSDGSLTGYAGGVDRKFKLLKLESTP